MTYRWLHDLADVLRDAGVPVVELPGWKQRGRPSYTGNFAPKGILWHHTGGASNGRQYAEWMAMVGRSDLPAPLCQLSIDRQGVWYVSAAGRANHAGAAKKSGPLPAGDGNSLYIGIEAHNTGSEGWSKVQLDSMVCGGAALTKHYRWTAEHNRAHRETSVTGKWDPGLLNMDAFRAAIADELNRPEEITVTPVDFLRYKLFGKKQGGRTVADVLREDNANLRKIAEDTAVIRSLLEAGEDAPKAP